MPTWEEKLFTIHDDLTRRISSCCGTLDYFVDGSCGSCRIDGQLRGGLSRYITAGNLKRPAGMPAPPRLKVADPLAPKASGSGIAPLTGEEKEDFRRKLQGASAAGGGSR